MSTSKLQSALAHSAALDRRDQPFYEELRLASEAIGYGRAQQILGELWDAMLVAQYGVGGRGGMGVTVKDKRPEPPRTVTGDGAGEMPELPAPKQWTLNGTFFSPEQMQEYARASVAQALKAQAAEPAVARSIPPDADRLICLSDALTACPGGDICDPQEIADALRCLPAAEQGAPALSFYVSGPYHNGSFAVCELSTSRVLRVFQTEADLLGPQRFKWSYVGAERYRVMAASVADADADEPGAALLTDEQKASVDFAIERLTSQGWVRAADAVRVLRDGSQRPGQTVLA